MAATNYIWDSQADSYLMATDQVGTPTAVYTQMPSQYGGLISQRRGTERRYYYQQALGSTRLLADESGTVTDTFSYDACGSEVMRTGSTDVPFRWIGDMGYYFDADLGTYYVRARMYGPVTARWLSADPAGFLAGLNLYVLTLVLTGIDPSGLLAAAPKINQVNFDDCFGGKIDDQTKDDIEKITGTKPADINKLLTDKVIVGCRQAKDKDGKTFIQCGYFYMWKFQCMCKENIVQDVVTQVTLYGDNGRELRQKNKKQLEFVEVFASTDACDIHTAVFSAPPRMLDGVGISKMCVEKTLTSCCGTFDGKTATTSSKGKTTEGKNPDVKNITCTSDKKKVKIKFCMTPTGSATLSTTGIDSGEINAKYPPG